MREGIRDETVSVETEKRKVLEKAEKLLVLAFSEVLPPEEATRRALKIRETKILTPTEFRKMRKKGSLDYDSEGFLEIDINQRGIVSRRAVVKRRSSQVSFLSTVLHEGIHLMSPDGNLIAGSNFSQNPEDWNFSSFLGAVRYERGRKTKAVDPLSIYENPRGRALFWEGATDWLASEILSPSLTPRQRKQLEKEGYVLEKIYFQFLADRVPDREEFIKKIKEAYVKGEEDIFRWYLHEITGRQDDSFYDELLDIFKMPNEEWETKIEKLMAAVDRLWPKK
jgi:hypothetical protein